MAEKDKAEEQEELSEEQRISMLEKSVTANKVVLLILALTLIIAISVTLTTMIISSMSEDGALGEQEAFIQIQLELTTLKEQVAAQQATITKSEQAYAALKGLLDNSSAPTFQRILLQQEKSYQEFIKSMKSGMYDLAHMVPGSRTWLELYTEQMNSAVSLSQQRERDLKRLQTGEPLIEPDF
ncbi:hypothetical protein [Alkalimarinus alittae]|uniref:Uncharacterized protein n=1 Tax=Alkalimarinus alittae TaxID=2961619 RepID=A0ABY6N0L9_9ALTE|nr:hypothetical protein [Alkalimarinus alittae]UZE95652.1 hypothetical protein NKI27_16555 [Alkalimarinus alittae]